MAMDFTSPKTTDNYTTAFVPNILSGFVGLAMMLDATLVGTYTGLQTGMKRFNESTHVLERYDLPSTTWSALTTGYMLKGGDTFTGAPVIVNNVGLQWKNTSGTNIVGSLLDSSNNFFFGDVNNSITGSSTSIRANSTVNLGINGSNVLSIQATIVSVNQVITSTSTEAFRIENSGGYYSGFNTANTTRTGYLQFNAATNVTLAAENGASILMMVGGSNRMSIGTSGDVTLNTGNLVLPNNKSVYFADAGGTTRNVLSINGSNNVQFGDVSGGLSGGYVQYYATSFHQFVLSGSQVMLVGTGGPQVVAGQLSFTSGGASEAIRIQHDGGYIAFWNSANATRTGYIQGVNGGYLSIIADTGNTLKFGSGGSARATLDLNGVMVADAGFATTAYVVNARNPIWYFYNSAGYGLSYFQGTSGMNGVDSLGFHFGTGTAAASVMSLAVDRVVVTPTFLVNTNSSAWTTTGRGVIEVNGTTALYGFKISGASAGYIYHDGTHVNFYSGITGGAIKFTTFATGTPRLQINDNGVSQFNGSAYTTRVPIGSQSTLTVDWSKGNYFTMTLTANVVSAGWVFTNYSDGQTITLRITQDGTGTRTIAANSSIKWPNGVLGVLSTAAGAVDIMCLTYDAGTGFFYATLAKAFA